MFFPFIFWSSYLYYFIVQLVTQQHNIHLASPAHCFSRLTNELVILTAITFKCRDILGAV